MNVLYVGPSPHGETDSTDLHLRLGDEDLGTLVIPLEHIAEFMRGLEQGFREVRIGRTALTEWQDSSRG